MKALICLRSKLNWREKTTNASLSSVCDDMTVSVYSADSYGHRSTSVDLGLLFIGTRWEDTRLNNEITDWKKKKVYTIK